MRQKLMAHLGTEPATLASSAFSWSEILLIVFYFMKWLNTNLARVWMPNLLSYNSWIFLSHVYAIIHLVILMALKWYHLCGSFLQMELTTSLTKWYIVNNFCRDFRLFHHNLAVLKYTIYTCTEEIEVI